MTTDTPITFAFIGNFGGGEIILIFLIVLLLFAKVRTFPFLGKGVNEFQSQKRMGTGQDVMSQEPLEDHDF